MVYDSFSSLIINVILVKNLKKVYNMTVLKSQKGANNCFPVKPKTAAYAEA